MKHLIQKLLTSTLFLTIITYSVYCQVYNFPIKPGTKEWKELKTGKQMHDVCQISKDILKNMSSDALAESCMKYPLYFEFTAFNDEIKGITYVIENFNGLKELSQRKDGASSLLKIYKKMVIQTKEGYIETGKISSVLNFEYIELLLSADVFLNQLDSIGMQELKAETLAKYGEKLNHVNIYGIHGICKSLLLCAKLLDRNKPNNINKEKIKRFIQNYNSASKEEIEQISKIITENEK
jgi:hypothetical protein